MNFIILQAEAALRGTFSADKNELLFTKFNINYNALPAMFRKGTILLRKRVQLPGTKKDRQLIVPLHTDMIRDKFWKEHTELLGKKSSAALFQYVTEETGEAILPELVLHQIKCISAEL